MTANLSTATITRDEARERIDRLRSAIHILSAASYQRGLSVDGMGAPLGDIAYHNAVEADDNARLRLFAELDIVADLMLGLIEERTRSATAMRLLTEDGAA